MNTTIESAIDALTAKITAASTPDEALKFTQAALNLAHTEAILVGRTTAPYDAGPLPAIARLYYELLDATPRVHGETRHETALRILRGAQKAHADACVGQARLHG